jgi:hypothetical protein
MAAILDVGEDQRTQICLEEDHQRSITYKFGPIWPCGFHRRSKCEKDDRQQVMGKTHMGLWLW